MPHSEDSYASSEATYSDLKDQIQRLQRELQRVTSDNERLHATATPSNDGHDMTPSEFSAPTSSTNMSDPRSSSILNLAIPHAMDDLLGSDWLNDRPFFYTARAEPGVTQEQQEPFRSIPETTGFSPFSAPLEEPLSSPVDNSNKQSIPHSAGPCGVKIAKSLKRKHEYVERIFDSRSARLDDREQEVKRGRRGPLSTDTTERQKGVRNRGGACWRCRMLKKPCDDKDICLNCKSVKSTASIWTDIGCRRGSLNHFHEGQTDYQEAEILKILQEQIDILRDQFNSISQIKHESKADVIIKVLDTISVATSNNSLELYSKTIQRVVSICEGLHPNVSLRGKVVFDCWMRFSVVLRDCYSEICRQEIVMLWVFALSSIAILATLIEHFQYEEHNAEVNLHELLDFQEELYQSLKSKLCNRLEPFIFRKKRSDLQHFREWLYIVYLTDDKCDLFIASTQGVVNLSPAKHKTERDAVKELLTQIISEKKFHEDGSVDYPDGIEFVARVGGLSPFDRRGNKRTIAKSSVLGQMPEESCVILKAFMIDDQRRLRESSNQ